MKIVIVNGSPRKQGATAQILEIMRAHLEQKEEVEIAYFHLDEMQIGLCKGCCRCFKSGKCFIDDDAERLSHILGGADGIIIGSPTYASNVSGQLKTFIDRGHLIIEQLLCNKYAIGVITSENYGGIQAGRILRSVLRYSGAFISSEIRLKLPFSNEPTIFSQTEQLIQKSAERLYKDIKTKRVYPIQKMLHQFIFNRGIKPFVIRKGKAYAGVLTHWERNMKPIQVK